MARKRQQDDLAAAPDRKRARSRAQAAEQADPGQSGAPAISNSTQQGNQAAAAMPAEGPGDTRRDQMAQIARQRAAHFAHFQVEEDEDAQDNAHVGGTEARNLGPWSSARQLVEARAQAAAARADRHKDKAAHELPKDSSPIKATWSPTRDSKLGPLPPKRVPALLSMTLSLLVEHCEDVESLWGLPDVLRVRLAAEISAKRKLTPEAAKLFVEGAPGEVVLPDCVKLEEGHIISLLEECCTSKLERLELGFCGHGLTDAAAAVLRASCDTATACVPSLRVLALSGAYKITDAAVMQILSNAPVLEELHLPNCSRLQGPVLHTLAQQLPGLRVLNLAQCRGISAQCLRSALASPPALPELRTLSLAGTPELSDLLLADIALALPKLVDVTVSRCGALTDAGLRGVAAASPGLLTLRIDEVGRVTDRGIAALVEGCPRLEVLSIQRCQKVTDAPLVELAAGRCLKRLGINGVISITDATIIALATHCRETLEELDASWCRNVTARALGQLADACPNLQTLRLFGCSQVDSSMLLGHSNDLVKVIGAPAAQMSLAEPAKMMLQLAEPVAA